MSAISATEQKLSVIIPCFNEENTIEELVQRVLAQPQVFEVIIIDDCSTDKSVEIIKKRIGPIETRKIPTDTST